MEILQQPGMYESLQDHGRFTIPYQLLQEFVHIRGLFPCTKWCASLEQILIFLKGTLVDDLNSTLGTTLCPGTSFVY